MIKNFLINYVKNSKSVAVIVTLLLISISADLIFPIVLKEGIDTILPQKRYNIFFFWIGAMFLIYTLKTFLDYKLNFKMDKLGIKIQYEMRKKIFQNISQKNFSFFDNKKTGDIISRAINDLHEIAELYSKGLENFILIIVKTILSVFIMFWLCRELAFIVLIQLLIMIGFSIFKNKKMKLLYMQNREKLSDINSSIEETISGIREVKSFANEEIEIKKFDISNKNFLVMKKEIARFLSFYFSGIAFLSNFTQLTVLAVGGILYLKGNLTIGVIVSFLMYVNRFLEPVRRITYLIELYQKGMSGFRRYNEIMEDSNIENDGGVDIENFEGDIEFKNVTFSYGNKKIIENLNLFIKKGEHIGIFGKSGIGKSSFASLIMGFYKVDSGEILIDGINIEYLSKKTLRKNIGIVRQSYYLFNTTIKENILYGNPEADEEMVIEALKKVRLFNFINSLENGMDSVTGEKGVKLSGGQRQRIALARVFIKNPTVIIFDEATASIDKITENEILNDYLKESKGKTRITITHRTDMKTVYDKILVMEENYKYKVINGSKNLSDIS
jgi:ATP-binding cassette, subfamily B, bacterial